MTEASSAPASDTARPAPAGIHWLVRNVLQLGALLGILLILSQGVVSWLAATAFEARLLPEVNRQVQLAGELAASQIGEAVALGIPVDKLVGIDEFFDEVFAQNPNIQQLTLVAADGDQRLHEGMASAAVIPDQAPQSVVMPVVVEGQPVARLQVQYEGYSAAPQLAALRSDRATVVIAAWLAGLAMLLIFVWARIRDPFSMAENALVEGAKGDFTQVVGDHQHGEVERFGHGFNEAVHQVNTSFDEFVAEAEEASAAQFDRKERERISDLVTAMRARFSFAQPLRETLLQLSSPRSAWFAVFLFLLGQEMLRPFLAVWFSDAPVAAHPAGTLLGGADLLFSQLVTATAVAFGASRWLRAGDPRVFFFFGVVVTIVSHVGSAFGRELASLWIWSVLAGAGLGAVLFAALAAEIWQRRERESGADRLLTLAGTAVVAIACGAAFGGVLVDRLGLEVALMVAGGITAVSGGLAFVFLTPVAKIHFNSTEYLVPRAGSAAGPLAPAGSSRPAIPGTVLLPVGCLAASLAGGLYYLIPHYVVDQGFGLAVIGRALLVYGVIVVLALQLFGSTRFKNIHSQYMYWFGVVAMGAGSMLPAFTAGGLMSLFSGLVLMGFGHVAMGWWIAGSLPGAATNHSRAETLRSKQPVARLLMVGLGTATLGVLIAGMLHEAVSIRLAILVFGGLLVAILVLARLVGRGPVVVGSAA